MVHFSHHRSRAAKRRIFTHDYVLHVDHFFFSPPLLFLRLRINFTTKSLMEFILRLRYGMDLHYARALLFMHIHTHAHTGLRETTLLVTIIAPRHHTPDLVACDGNFIKAAAKPNVTKCQASKSRRWFDCVMSFFSDLFAVTLISTYSGHESAPNTGCLRTHNLALFSIRVSKSIDQSGYGIR